MIGLTPAQRDALQFIAGYIAAHGGVGPSYDEIAAALGLRSKSGVLRLVVELEERGRITRIPRAARSIAIVEHGDAVQLRPATLARLERHCLAHGERLTDFVDDAVAEALDRAHPAEHETPVELTAAGRAAIESAT